MDLSRPDRGNPGVGGTAYCFLMLIYYLRLFEDIEVTVFHYNENQLPKTSGVHRIQDAQESIALSAKMRLSFLVHEQMRAVPRWYELLAKYQVESVLWAHNYLFLDEMKKLPGCAQVRRVVFVGKEQYDSYMDHPVIGKSAWIYNFCEDRKLHDIRRAAGTHTVVYVGSLVKMKGFHILAKQWKRILRKVPDARLLVLGSGRLYDRSQKLGAYGIAEEGYEKEFMRYLTDADGKLLDSVSFEGIVGQDKCAFFSQSCVGVVNPSAKSETFCLSAVEMELASLPVVAGRNYGLYDTVENGKTGYLVRNGRELSDRIIELLVDTERNERMGKAARRFAQEKFDSMRTAERWHTLFHDLDVFGACVYDAPGGNWGNDRKWLKRISRSLGGFGINQIERTVKYKLSGMFCRDGWKNV